MELVDTHCHIQSIGAKTGERHTKEIWQKSGLNADQAIDNATKAGVTKLICVGCDPADSQQAIDFVKNRPGCFASLGIHPHEAKIYANQPDKLAAFAQLVNQPKVVAIGECGLDFYYNHSPKADQIKLLKFQLELAKTHTKPVIFHVREAFTDFWPIYDEFKELKGVLHSFTDNQDSLNEALKRGLYIGVNGIATFTKDPAQLDVYKAIPLDHLLLETDAPFLTPTPYRGTVNEPKRVVEVAGFLTSLRSEDSATLARVTSQNATKLFGL